MLDRIFIVVRLIAFNALLFSLFNFLMPAVIAATLSMIAVFGYAFLPDNEQKMIKLKRPTLYTKG